MNAKKITCTLTAASLLLPAVALSGCGNKEEIRLRVYSWEEYIDEGGEGSYVYDVLEEENAPALIDDFESWYEQTYGTPIRVEYSTFGTNEDMYNQLKLGDTYDLVCPSDYMIMKLAAENMLEPLSDGFYDAENELNYYVNNVSPYIRSIFDNGKMTADGGEHSWSEYAAGYMWGTTGLIYNPEAVSDEALAQGWGIMLDPAFRKKVTTKDNVRDSYFVGLAIYYKEELLRLKSEYDADALSTEEYNRQITLLMNDTDEKTVAEVQNILLQMKENIYGFETDTGKSDMVKGNIFLNFAWSGDAVYALDLAEEEDTYLNYYIPEECANLFFDGWAMPKGANKQAAEAFINFLSMPANAVRNSYFIGYTSVIAGEEILSYAEETYGAEEDSETAEWYDLSYFFGEEAGLYVEEEQLNRQLYAQYPPEEAIRRCAVMDYYGENEARVNELWTKVKGASLDGWAIAVICVGVAGIAAFAVFVKLGGKIDFFRRKPKKGYERIKQEPLS